jgi:UDP-N-acetylglucosamine 2-epimerase
VETTRSGGNVLVGTETKRIVEEVRHKVGGKRVLKNVRIFGDGKASERIVQILFNSLAR